MTVQQISPGWVSYLRVSDEDKQTPERSFAMQRAKIEEQLLSSSNEPLLREYCDLLSGTNPNRKDYQQMLRDAELGKFSQIGLYRADRFGRNTIEGLQAATKLISLGVKIRVASMPSLRPEDPDGFFMFLIQMGMAQREVDVMCQRTRDGTQAKLMAGGWANKAPEGYRNCERQIKSGKYERWVEPDPQFNKQIREAWDLLLTGRYSLDQICEELTKRGYTRSNGSPWAWYDNETRYRKTAKNRLHFIFQNPFYAGWIASKKFNIKIGEIQGIWKPTITTEEFEKGISILNQHGQNKTRFKKKFYLLRNILWIRLSDSQYKMYGSTPSGRTQSYSYYITHALINGKKLHINTQIVDDQIQEWIKGITINQDSIPIIRDIYLNHIKQVAEINNDEDLDQLQRKLASLQQEEARLGRLLITGNISEESFSQLSSEWQEKVRNIQLRIREFKHDTNQYLDDLEIALILMTKLSELYIRLNEKQKYYLLQILVKRIFIDKEGTVIDYELNSPFEYLNTLAIGFSGVRVEGNGSDQGLCIPKMNINPKQPQLRSEQFNKMMRFEQRSKLNELPITLN